MSISCCLSFYCSGYRTYLYAQCLLSVISVFSFHMPPAVVRVFHFAHDPLTPYTTTLPLRKTIPCTHQLRTSTRRCTFQQQGCDPAISDVANNPLLHSSEDWHIRARQHLLVLKFRRLRLQRFTRCMLASVHQGQTDPNYQQQELSAIWRWIDWGRRMCVCNLLFYIRLHAARRAIAAVAGCSLYLFSWPRTGLTGDN